MRRLGAAIIAVLMVLVALWARGRIDDDDGNGASGDGVLRVLCATELADVCNKVSSESNDVVVLVEPAGQTADALEGESGIPGFDAWLTIAPWPEIVDVRRRVNGLEPIFETPRDQIARSPLVLVVRAERETVLAATPECGGTVTWECVGALAGRPWDSIGGSAAWGRIRPGHADPSRSAIGLLVLSQATSDFLGGESYSLFDLQNNDDFRDWLTTLEQAIPAGRSSSPFLELLQQPVYDAVGTVEAEAGPGLARAARDRRRQFHLLYPDPVITADVVLATVSGADTRAVDDLVAGDALRGALAQAGWRVKGEPGIPGVRATPLPATDGLPEAGVLVALQQEAG